MGRFLRISIHALRVEGDTNEVRKSTNNTISIHALRVEGDVQIVVGVAVDLNFYPRPPGGGRLIDNGII